ncbi:Di-copper centre-containing protein, partial [Basidiobolus meristosporus CBS 931.73]
QQLKTLEIFDRFADIHNSYVPFAHGTPAFLPWHRYFIRLYEYALQLVVPEVVIPYWDWSLDSQAPEKSFIFKIIGGNGQGPKNCVQDGPFANWTVTVPLPHCLTRKFNGEKGRILALWSPESIKFLRDSYETYGTFVSRFEQGPHGVMHQAINGDMVNFFSPNDPVFYLHHGFVDKNWALWQAKAPQNYRDYGG